MLTLQKINTAKRKDQSLLESFVKLSQTGFATENDTLSIKESEESCKVSQQVLDGNFPEKAKNRKS